MNLLGKIFYHVFLVLVMSIVIIAGQVEITSTGFNLIEYFYTIPALAGAVLLLTGYIKTALKITGGFSQYLSWILSAALSLLGWMLNLGIFAGVEWYFILVYGAAAGLIANGLFDFALIKALLTLLKLEPRDNTVIIGGK